MILIYVCVCAYGVMFIDTENEMALQNSDSGLEYLFSLH